MRLHGTLTSPFVRRVRVVATELGQTLTLIDTSTAAGQASLAACSPLAKVPVLEIGGVPVLDSHAIIDLLLNQHGHGGLRPRRPHTLIQDSNMIHIVDGALEAAIRVFYCQRDGVDFATVPYLQRERDRVTRSLAWLDAHVRGAFCTREDGFGIAELAVVTTFEWMQFRQAADLSPYANLQALVAAHTDRPSLVATRPPT